MYMMLGRGSPKIRRILGAFPWRNHKVLNLNGTVNTVATFITHKQVDLSQCCDWSIGKQSCHSLNYIILRYNMKRQKLLIAIPIMAVVFALIGYLVYSSITTNVLSEQYGYYTMYESSYYQSKNCWWIFLPFVSLCIVPFVLGIKKKNIVVIAVSSVLAMSLVVFSLSMLSHKNSYSDSKEILADIEESINCSFPDNTSVLLEKNKSSNLPYAGEGVIRLPVGTELEGKVEWQIEIEQGAKQHITDIFYIIASSSDKFFYKIEGNVMIFLAYNEENHVIYFMKTAVS